MCSSSHDLQNFWKKHDFDILSQEFLAKQQAAQHMVQQRQAIMMGKATWNVIMWWYHDDNERLIVMMAIMEGRPPG